MKLGVSLAVPPKNALKVYVNIYKKGDNNPISTDNEFIFNENETLKYIDFTIKNEDVYKDQQQYYAKVVAVDFGGGKKSISENSPISGESAGDFEQVIVYNDSGLLSVEDTETPVDIKIVPVDENGNPLVDDDGNLVSSSTIEGEKAYYKAVLVDESGNEIQDDGTVTINITDGTATSVTDYDNSINTQTVKLGTVFSVATKDDVYKENDEKFNVGLSDFSNASKYEKVNYSNIDTTIKDDKDPVIVRLSPKVKANNVTFNVVLDYKALKDTTITLNQNDIYGNPITVTVRKDTKEASTTATMKPGEYDVEVKSVNHVGIKVDDYESVDLPDAKHIKISIDVSPVCIDVKEDEDICEEGNIFVGEKQYDLRVEDDRPADKRGDDEGPLMTLKGDFGVLVLNTQTGDYKYTLDNDSSKVQEMNEDELITEKFEVKITNNRGFEAKKEINVKIHGTNDIPVAHDDTATMKEDDAPITIDVLANDTDVDSTGVVGETFSVDSVDPVKKGFVQVVDNKVVFDPKGDFDYLKAGESETVKIHYSMSDAQGASSSAYATLKVTGVDGENCPLVVADDCAFVVEGESVIIDVLENDSGKGLSVTKVEGVDHGSVDILSDGRLRYTANPAPTTTHIEIDEDTGAAIEVKDAPFVGSDDITYTVKDAFGATKSATASVHIASSTNYRDNFIGSDKTDFVIAGKGNDYLEGRGGDDKYFFSTGDGDDTILDTAGSDDGIMFTPHMDTAKEDLKFKVESDGDFVIDYGNGDTITVKYQEFKDNGTNKELGIERVEMDSGCYLNQNDIDKMVQFLSAHHDSSYDLAQINSELQNNNQYTQIVWHQG
ncbi:MAG: hypothetical protein DSZ06_01765 [Sulfurospirillum sp.]|nr:MAG: hypothetical protein DSZ06_01765 [Sulfurospirillum sp.]